MFQTAIEILLLKLKKKHICSLKRYLNLNLNPFMKRQECKFHTVLIKIVKPKVRSKRLIRVVGCDKTEVLLLNGVRYGQIGTVCI